MDLSQLPPEVLEGPAGAPPAGVVPNLIDPPTKGPVLIGLPAALVVCMWIFVVVRVVAKARVVKRITIDDYTCVIAAILTTMYFGITTASVQYEKIGTHIWNVRLGDYLGNSSIKIEFLSAIMAPPTLFFVRVTFFFMFLHIFRPVVLLRILCWIGIAVTAVGYTTFFIISFVFTVPRYGETWQSHFVGPLQFQEANISIPLPAFSLALDIVILILPIYGIWNLQLATKRKLGLAAIFLTAILAIICSILSITFRLDLQGAGEDDLTYKLMPAYLTSDLEMSLGVIVSCMPTFSGAVTRSLPFYSSLKSLIKSRFSSRNSAQRVGSGDTGNIKLAALPGQSRKTSQWDAVHDNAEKPNQGLTNHVTANKVWNTSQDGILLTTELRQESSAV